MKGLFEILPDSELQKILVNELLRFLRGNFQEKMEQISQLIVKCFNADKQFLRERAIGILQKIRKVEGEGPRCFFCGEPLTLSVFLGMEEALVVTSQCPSCEMNWYVEPKIAETFIQSLGGEEKVVANLVALDQPRQPSQREKVEVINMNPQFQESITKFFEGLLQKPKENKGIEEKQMVKKDKKVELKCPECDAPLKYADIKSIYPHGYWYCAECNVFFAKRKEGYGWRKKEQVLRGWHSEWEVTIIGETTKV